MTKRIIVFLSIFCAGMVNTTIPMSSDSIKYANEIDPKIMVIIEPFLRRNDFSSARKKVYKLRHKGEIDGETRQKLIKLIKASELDAFMRTALAEKSTITDVDSEVDNTPARKCAKATADMTCDFAAAFANEHPEAQLVRHRPAMKLNLTGEEFQMFSSKSDDEPKSDSRVLSRIAPATREKARRLILISDFDAAFALLHTSSADEETITQCIRELLDEQCAK